jgi:hypothetical protein
MSVLEAEHGNGGRFEQEMLRRDHWQINPSHTEDPTEVAMREYCHIPVKFLQASQHSISTLRNLFGGFSVWTSVLK